MKSPVVLILASLSLISVAFADEPAPSTPAPADASSGAERVNVDNIKEKYWAQGNEAELGVVQNRLYSKERKIEFGLFGGILSSDPFLSVQNTGASIGFHFSEYLSAHVIAWKSFASPSSALTTFEEKTGGTTNNNHPLSFYGAEGRASLLYGKLSLVGKAIIYYDMHILGGLGATKTESGDYFTPSLGVGQKIFLHKSVSLMLNYRMMVYREMILEKVVPTKLGTPVEPDPWRTNWTHAITLGVDFLFGGFQ